MKIENKKNVTLFLNLFSRRNTTNSQTKHGIYCSEGYKIWQGSWLLFYCCRNTQSRCFQIEQKITALPNSIIHEKHFIWLELFLFHSSCLIRCLKSLKECFFQWFGIKYTPTLCSLASCQVVVLQIPSSYYVNRTYLRRKISTLCL